MEEQQKLMTQKVAPKFTWQETDQSRYFHSGNIMFGKDGDIFIHARATRDKETFLKILIMLHERFIEECNDSAS